MNFSSGIHIVFSDAARRVLQNNQVITIFEQCLFSFNDDLRIGPIYHLNTQIGRDERANWLHQPDFNHLLPELMEYPTKMKLLKNALQKNTELFIWCGNTLSEQLSTYRLISELNEYHDKINYLNVPQKHMIRSKFGHQYYPSCLNIMNPEEIDQIIGFIEKPGIILLDKWNTLWNHLSNSTGVLRVKDKTGKIIQETPDHFDANLLSFCGPEYVKPALIIAQALIAIDFETNDFFLNWRLKDLVQKGKLEYTGKPGEMKDYRVRLPGNQ